MQCHELAPNERKGFLVSRGLGVVQRRLIAAFESEPTRHFTIRELAELAFPGTPIERKHEVSVRRTVRNLPDLNLHFCRAGKFGAHGWRYVVGCTG